MTMEMMKIKPVTSHEFQCFFSVKKRKKFRDRAYSVTAPSKLGKNKDNWFIININKAMIIIRNKTWWIILLLILSFILLIVFCSHKNRLNRLAFWKKPLIFSNFQEDSDWFPPIVHTNLLRISELKALLETQIPWHWVLCPTCKHRSRYTTGRNLSQ